MLSFLKTKKSAGVRVTPAVHQLISRANAARDEGDWNAAAQLYREALACDRSLVHIWIQLGHAEKERGRLDDAEASYIRASMLVPSKAEPLLHLGHAYKVMGDTAGAARSYLRAARLDPMNAQALNELQHIISRTAVLARPDLIALLRGAIFGEEERSPQPAPSLSTAETLLFDVSSLINAAFSGEDFGAAERIGQDLLPALLRQSNQPIRLCAHVIGHARWLAISTPQLAQIMALGRQSGVGFNARRTALSDLDLSLLLSAPFEMPKGALLIDLDAAHAPPDHALFVRHARRARDVRYIAFGSSLPADLQSVSDLQIPTDREELSIDAIWQAIAGAIPAGPDCPKPEVRAARFERLGKGNIASRSRNGTGWLPPEDWGCWLGISGGDVEIVLPELENPRLYVQLRALLSARTSYRIALTDGRHIAGEIESGRQKWVVIDDLPIHESELKLRINGENSEPVAIGNSPRKLPVSVGVTGFFLCGRDDRAARMALVENSMFGNLEGLC